MFWRIVMDVVEYSIKDVLGIHSMIMDNGGVDDRS